MTAPFQPDFSLIDLALAEQRDLTAIGRFARIQDRPRAPRQKYRDLIPLTRPGPGEQYGFVVDLDRCSACKACVSACHSLNGLEEDEMWRSTGTIVGEEEPYLQTITSSCHHCVDPACAAGCPVLAYEKDSATGIVRHLDDQCIGCQYCVLKCPYDVPKYSKRKGIVRKCDLCHSRLAADEAPACAQACPHEAIRVEVVSQAAIRTESASPGARMIPGAFPSNYTLPATRYQTAKPPSRARSVHGVPAFEHAHWPLVWMLILTQMAAGLHLAGSLLNVPGLAVPAALTLFAGLGASVFHLGRPLKAWRAFLGWRRSWMSREILVFSAYAGLAALLVLAPGNPWLAAGTAVAGLFAVFCSAMIYVDTRRPGWEGKNVFPAFFGSAFLLGPTAAAAICGWIAPAFAPMLAAVATMVRTVLFGWRWSALLAARPPVLQLAPGPLRATIGLFAVSTAFSIMAIVNFQSLGAWWGTIACVSTLAAQVIDRWLFFAATPAPRMPGAMAPPAPGTPAAFAA